MRTNSKPVKMRSLIIYYVLIVVPLAALIYAARSKSIDSLWFFILLLIYVLVYRSFTDYYRLRNKKVIDGKDFWRILIPGARAKYFKDLYLL